MAQADARPGPVKAFTDEADRAGRLLGDDHDLATLSERLGSLDAPPSVDVDRIRELVAARRAELQTDAFEVGQRLCSEKPAAFARRLGGYGKRSGEPLARCEIGTRLGPSTPSSRHRS